MCFKSEIYFIEKIKRIALVAHDNRKKDLIEWVDHNWVNLKKHSLLCAGTEGRFVEETINKRFTENGSDKISVKKLKSGPLGGDQQLGALISEGSIDLMIFFWDPMQPQAHDVDVKALLRITVLYNIPTACNRSTADFMITSNLFNDRYTPKIKDYSGYLNRIL